MSSSIPQTSGIYKIVCLPTGKVYVGSAINLVKRWRTHLCVLRQGKHSNSYLQHAWSKYGEDAFEFIVIEEILSPFLIEREQYWIDRLKCTDHKKGFNHLTKAGSVLGLRHSEESRRRISEGHKNAYTEEMREAARAAQNRRWQSPGYREQAARAHSQYWIVTDPSGTEHRIHNLRQFCREHGLDTSHMNDVARGVRRKQHKGWLCRRDDSEV